MTGGRFAAAQYTWARHAPAKGGKGLPVCRVDLGRPRGDHEQDDEDLRGCEEGVESGTFLDAPT